jgi:hypothetical protein
MRGQMTHLDVEVLAEFREGLITGRRGTRITAHLAGCGRCTALGDQLAGVSALLAAAPRPAMPDHLAQRLDTVLAAEAARPYQANQDHQAERVDAERPVDPAPDRRRAPRPRFRLVALRVLAPVAVVVLAAGGYGLSRLTGTGGQVTASSGAAAQRSSAEASASQGAAAKSAPSAASSAASSNAVNGPQSPPVRGAAGTAPRAQRLTSANFTLVASGTDFSAVRATFRQQVEHELGSATPAGASRTPGVSGIRLAVSAQLRACVQNLTRGASLVRVESARFEGKPATLVVARTGTDEVAWITGPDCSATSRDVLATATVPAGTSEP